MAGIAGIAQTNPQPIQDRLERMTRAQAYRGPDGVACWHDGHAALAHLALHTTPESRRERQPVTSDDGRLYLVADARIDNRAELIPQLRRSGLLANTQSTDAEIILAAYRRWGQQGVARLIGDFTFALWDQPNRRLFAARDPMGMRQLFFTVNQDTLMLATSIGAIVRGLASRPELNRPVIEAFLRQSYRPLVSETVYAGIQRLPPAHQLIWENGRLKQELYYALGSSSPESFANDTEWVEAFRGLFDTVIREQFRSDTPVGIWLSGGLDSSSLACAAHDLVSRDRLDADIKLYASVFDDTPLADEREYIALVEKVCPGFDSRHVISDDHWAFREFGGDDGFPLDEPEVYVTRANTSALLHRAAADGCRIVVTGDMANCSLGDTIYCHPEALRGVPASRVFQEARHYKAPRNVSWLGLFLRAFLPQRVMERYRSRSQPAAGFSNDSVPWLKPRHASSAPTQHTIDPRFFEARHASLSGRIIHRYVRKFFDLARLANLDTACAHAGVEMRLPFLDRRIVEFAMGMPQHLACDGGINRVILRKGLRDILPAAICSRLKGQGDQRALVFRGFDKERRRIAALASNPHAAALGFIDAAVFEEHLACVGRNQDQEIEKFLPSLSLEAWLRDTYFSHAD